MAQRQASLQEQEGVREFQRKTCDIGVKLRPTLLARVSGPPDSLAGSPSISSRKRATDVQRGVKALKRTGRR